MPEEVKQCLNCGRTEDEVPLITLQSMGKQKFVCPQCLPTLIHAPQKLAGKLPGAESMTGAQHKH